MDYMRRMELRYISDQFLKSLWAHNWNEAKIIFAVLFIRPDLIKSILHMTSPLSGRTLKFYQTE